MQQLLPRSLLNGRYALPPSKLSGFAPRGMGDGVNVAGAVGGASSIASALANPTTPTSTKIESSIAGALATAASVPSPATPFLLIGAAIAEALAAFGVGSGCGQTCVLTTQFANKANSLLQQNIETYFTAPVRYQSAQAAALANFDSMWAWLQQQCSNPQLGNAGVRCITDRQAGACTWKQPASSVPPWGTPAAGECWNWFNGYRDPIANDTAVQPDPVGTITMTQNADGSYSAAPAAGSSPSTSPATSTSGTGINPLYLIGGAAILAFALMGGDN